MTDVPANQAPVKDDAIEHLYGRKGATTGDGFVRFAENQFAHAVGLTGSDKGKTPYVDANGDMARLAAGSSSAMKYMNSSGLPAWTAAGTDGQIMTLSGAVPTWATVQASYRFILSQTGSGATSIDFTSGFDSSYDEYVFLLVGVYPSTSSSRIDMRVSLDAGASFVASAYEYAAGGANPAAAIFEGSNSTSEFRITSANGPTNSAAAGVDGEARLILSNTKAGYTSLAGYRQAAPNRFSVAAAGSLVTASRANAVRFLASAGNINGTIRMYGVKNS